MSDAWSYALSTRAFRELEKIPREERRRIFAALDQLVLDPLSGDTRKLRGKHEQWRRRVGPWRILFSPDFKSRKIIVQNISHRSRAYRD